MSRSLIILVFSMCRKGVVFLILFKNTIRLSAGSLIASVDSLIAFFDSLIGRVRRIRVVWCLTYCDWVLKLFSPCWNTNSVYILCENCRYKVFCGAADFQVGRGKLGREGFNQSANSPFSKWGRGCKRGFIYSQFDRNLQLFESVLCFAFWVASPRKCHRD